MTGISVFCLILCVECLTASLAGAVYFHRQPKAFGDGNDIDRRFKFWLMIFAGWISLVSCGLLALHI